MPAEGQPRTGYRRDIQGLRAVAVLLVCLGHARFWGLGGGYVGVDVFFVVSGFVITGLLLREAEKDRTISIVKFYARRARRILPAAVLTLVSISVAATLLLNFVRARQAIWDGIFAAGFAANFRFAAQGTNYFTRTAPPSPVLHYWSLSVEEQFYLVWPALAALTLFGTALLSRRRRMDERAKRRLFVVIAAATFVSFLWAVHSTATSSSAAYFSPLTRAWELGLGAAIAACPQVPVRLPQRFPHLLGWAGLTAIVAAAVAFDDNARFPGTPALLPTLGAAAIITAGSARASVRGSAGQLLALKPMRIVGDRSYALYLWHWPILILAAEYAGRQLSVVANLSLIAAAFLLSSLSYAFVENPIRRARWQPRAGAVVAFAAAAAVFVTATVSLAAVDARAKRFGTARAEPVIAVAATAHSHAHRESRRRSAADTALPQVVAAIRAAQSGAPIPHRLTPGVATLQNDWQGYALPAGCVPIRQSNASSSRVCRLGVTNSRRSIVLLGDSHADQWLSPLFAFARSDRWAVIPLLRPGCTPATWLDNWGASLCRDWFRWAVGQVGNIRPDVAIITGAVSNAWGPQIPAAVHGIVGLTAAVRPLSRHVVVIGDTEGLRRDPQECLLSRGALLRTCMANWWPAHLQRYNTVAARVRRQGVGFIDTRPWFCWQGHCPAVVGHTIVYLDQRHVTPEYVARLRVVFADALRRALSSSKRNAEQGGEGILKGGKPRFPP